MAKQYTAKYKSLPQHSVTNNSGIVEKNTGETPDKEIKHYSRIVNVQLLTHAHCMHIREHNMIK